MKIKVFSLLICFIVLGCSDVSKPVELDAQVEPDTQMTDAGCYGPTGTFKMVFTLQESTCDEEYTQGDQFTENIAFEDLECEKSEFVKWDYQHDAFYRCLSTLLVFADHYEGQWVCVLYHDMEHPFCGFSYKVMME